jgi:hypothetical protein
LVPLESVINRPWFSSLSVLMSFVAIGNAIVMAGLVFQLFRLQAKFQLEYSRATNAADKANA